MTIDCDDCAVRGPGCKDCVVSVLLGVPDTLLVDERAALEVLAEAGLAPRLRLVPIHRQGESGVLPDDTSRNGPVRKTLELLNLRLLLDNADAVS